MGDLQDDLNRIQGGTGLNELKVMLDHAKKTDIISNTGPYIAQVLRVSVSTNPATGLASELTNNNEGENLDNKGKTQKNPKPNEFLNVPWIAVHARISQDEIRDQPPIHSLLPKPTNLGSSQDVGAGSFSDRAIKLHHTFLGFKTDLPVPSPGDKIWVNFLNKNNGEFKNPVYIAPVLPDKTKIQETTPDTTPPSQDFRKDPKTGKMIPVNSDPASQKRTTGKAIPTGGTYTLHGYTWEQFTAYGGKGFYGFGRSNATQYGPPGQPKYFYDNVGEDLLSSIEVIHMFWKSMHPDKKIIVHHQTAAVRRKMKGSMHNVGLALDVQIKVNGERQRIKNVWASLIRLAAAGKIPDSAIGHYQQSKGDRTNTAGTDLEPDQSPAANNNPHYDTRIKKHWTMSQETGARNPKKGTKIRSKWNWTTVKKKNDPPGKKGEKKSTYRSFTAKQVEQWSGALDKDSNPEDLANAKKLKDGKKRKNPFRRINAFYPPHLRYALAAMSKPPSDLPTWEQVKQTRKQLLAQGATSLRGATV